MNDFIVHDGNSVADGVGLFLIVRHEDCGKAKPLLYSRSSRRT